jgi:hypothetical protein
MFTEVGRYDELVCMTTWSNDESTEWRLRQWRLDRMTSCPIFTRAVHRKKIWLDFFNHCTEDFATIDNLYDSVVNDATAFAIGKRNFLDTFNVTIVWFHEFLDPKLSWKNQRCFCLAFTCVISTTRNGMGEFYPRILRLIKWKPVNYLPILDLFIVH